MKCSERIGLLIVPLICFFAAGTDAGQPAVAKTKVIHLPRDVQVIHGTASVKVSGDYLISKGAKVDGEYADGTFFIESAAKLRLNPLINTAFIKKGGELETEGRGWLRIYYEKGAKIGKPNGEHRVLIECDSITFKPFQPFTLKGTVRNANGKPIAGIRVRTYDFVRKHLDAVITDRNGAFAFRPTKTVAYVAADLAPAWRADLAIRNNTDLSMRKHTQRLRGWEAEIREGFWGEDATLTIAPSGKRHLTLRQLHKLIGHDSDICSMAFSGDGHSLATASQGSLVRVWDVGNGKERRVFDMDCRTSDVSLNPNGKILAAVSGGSFLRLWDATKGELLRERNILPDRHSVAFAPDGKSLAVGVGASIHLWDVVNGRQRGLIRAHPYRVSNLVFKPDGRTLYSIDNIDETTSGDGSIRAWDVATGRELQRYTAGVAKQMMVSADGQWLTASVKQVRSMQVGNSVTVTSPHHVFVWQTDSGKQILNVECKADAVALTPDNKLLVALSGDVLHIWEVASGQEVLAAPVPDFGISQAVFSPNSRMLATARNRSGTVCLWDVRPHHLYVPETKSRSDAELEKLWSDLASDKAATAYRALWTLLREPPRAVTLLRTHLRPTPPRQLPLSQWIADLDNDDYAKRQAAAKSLREAGESAERVLRQALGNKPSLEARKRIEKILEEIDRRRPSAEELRSLRAIQLLEEIGSPEARRLLRTLAEGWSEARQTREAKAALKRRPK